MAKGTSRFSIKRASTGTSKKKIAIIGLVIAAGAVVVARLAPIAADLPFINRGRRTDVDAAAANGDDQQVRDLGDK